MVFVSSTMVFDTGTSGWETNTMVTKPVTILLATGKMVSLIKKIVCVANTMVFLIGTMVCVKNTMVPTSDTTVPAAKKMVSAAPTMVFEVLSIVFMIGEQSFANPKLFFGELRACARLTWHFAAGPQARWLEAHPESRFLQISTLRTKDFWSVKSRKRGFPDGSLEIHPESPLRLLQLHHIYGKT